MSTGSPITHYKLQITSNSRQQRAAKKEINFVRGFFSVVREMKTTRFESEFRALLEEEDEELIIHERWFRLHVQVLNYANADEVFHSIQIESYGRFRKWYEQRKYVGWKLVWKFHWNSSPRIRLHFKNLYRHKYYNKALLIVSFILSSAFSFRTNIFDSFSSFRGHKIMNRRSQNEHSHET